ncbi:MAG: DUF1902 domain-containing protein [Devosia sp.]|uniref:DUF1902 domain-containing protein n=1 Tax=Devosia sp. TaxID=1871048 RepID=UPI001AD09B74|nr:DUF1902 domain-containing protein [Devosia sp.]MBN9310254.1 DUF1902 domain-containing protein [Devosia sp.]MBN9317364.1 DUF1902 domain-containing protein [Devosia sp.]
MAKRAFYVRAKWDPTSRVYYTDSDIVGLHVEASTIEELEAIVMEVAPELIVSNHLSADDLVNKPMRELVPAILFEKPLAKAS